MVKYCCEYCGAEYFLEKEYRDHYKSDYNLRVLIRRFDSNEWDKYRYVFLDALNLDGNLPYINENIKESTLRLKCIVARLRSFGLEDIALYLESQSIEEAYKDLNNQHIEHIELKIQTLEEEKQYLEKELKERRTKWINKKS